MERIWAYITDISPDRWKVFQMLRVKGQNDGSEHLEITTDQFQHFVEQNQVCNPVAEMNDDMTSSYLMIGPLGRFFHNTYREEIGHIYSPPILSVGVEFALFTIEFDYQKLVNRGGIYNWEDESS